MTAMTTVVERKPNAADLIGQLVCRAIEQALQQAADPLSWQEIAGKVADVCRDAALVRTYINRLVTEGRLYRLGCGGQSKYWPCSQFLVVFHKKKHYLASLRRGKPVQP